MIQVSVVAITAGSFCSASDSNSFLLFKILRTLIEITKAEPQEWGPHRYREFGIRTATKRGLHWIRGGFLCTRKPRTNGYTLSFCWRSHNLTIAFWSFTLYATSRSLRTSVGLYDRWNTELASSTDPSTTLTVRRGAESVSLCRTWRRFLCNWSELGLPHPLRKV